MARRSPTPASSSRPRTCFRAPTRRTAGLDDHVGARLGRRPARRPRHARSNSIRDALKIAPGEPSVLTNLGLSYALTKELPLAEDALRQASASPRADARVRENLALVLALEGKFAEAETVSRQRHVGRGGDRQRPAIRQMIAQNDSWRDLQTGAQAAKTKRRSEEPCAASAPAACAACARPAARLAAAAAERLPPARLANDPFPPRAACARRLRLGLRRRDRGRRRAADVAGARALRLRSGRGRRHQQARRGTFGSGSATLAFVRAGKIDPEVMAAPAIAALVGSAAGRARAALRAARRARVRFALRAVAVALYFAFAPPMGEELSRAAAEPAPLRADARAGDRLLRRRLRARRWLVLYDRLSRAWPASA